MNLGCISWMERCGPPPMSLQAAFPACLRQATSPASLPAGESLPCPGFARAFSSGCTSAITFPSALSLHLAPCRSETPLLNIPALNNLPPAPMVAGRSAPLQSFASTVQSGLTNLLGQGAAQLAADGLLPPLQSLQSLQPPPPSPQGPSSTPPDPGTTQGLPVPSGSTKSGTNVGAIVAGAHAVAEELLAPTGATGHSDPD